MPEPIVTGSVIGFLGSLPWGDAGGGCPPGVDDCSHPVPPSMQRGGRAEPYLGWSSAELSARFFPRSPRAGSSPSPTPPPPAPTPLPLPRGPWPTLPSDATWSWLSPWTLAAVPKPSRGPPRRRRRRRAPPKPPRRPPRRTSPPSPTPRFPRFPQELPRLPRLPGILGRVQTAAELLRDEILRRQQKRIDEDFGRGEREYQEWQKRLKEILDEERRREERKRAARPLPELSSPRMTSPSISPQPVPSLPRATQPLPAPRPSTQPQPAPAPRSSSPRTAPKASPAARTLPWEMLFSPLLSLQSLSAGLRNRPRTPNRPSSPPKLGTTSFAEPGRSPQEELDRCKPIRRRPCTRKRVTRRVAVKWEKRRVWRCVSEATAKQKSARQRAAERWKTKVRVIRR